MKQYNGSVLSNNEDEVIRVNSDNYSDPDYEAPVVIEEVDEEYRSNEEDDFANVAAEETSPDFEGLRQRAISDDISNPYLIGTGIKDDENSEISQED